MHCLGAGAMSPSGGGSSQTTSTITTTDMTSAGITQNRGNVMNVVRALGVLVCEGRIQGPPKGYKEGPHCYPPLQSASNDHLCDKYNYLCERYSILVREITERINITSLLCVEVILCTDCPCGFIKAKSKRRVLTIPSTCQSSSELLLEYWCIGLLSSKAPETMNAQGLYQAVRSRLHFSQLAAWWSKSNGSNPSYIATRIVPYNEDHLNKFRETPSKHSFPLASTGDGFSVQVTMWALPRLEEVPLLNCSIHTSNLGIVPEVIPIVSPVVVGSLPAQDTNKSINVTSISVPDSQFQLYMSNFRAESESPSTNIVNEQVINNLNQSGKDDCQCGDEEVVEMVPTVISPLTGSAPGNISERKRRRSLPCRAADGHIDGLERSFRTQLHIESQRRQMQQQSNQLQQESQLIINSQNTTPPIIDGNKEKRYKRSREDSSATTTTTTTSVATIKESKKSSSSHHHVRNATNRRLALLHCAGVHQPNKKIVPKPNSSNELKTSSSGDNDNFLDWIASVPRGVLGNTENRNCSLGLSQQEFNEVLAVLRARTPLRAPTVQTTVQPGRRKERVESSPAKLGHSERLMSPLISNNNNNTTTVNNNTTANQGSKADVLLSAIMRSSNKEEQSLETTSTGISEITQLPAKMNKRLLQLRQLFKRDQWKPTDLKYCDNKAKKRIDFTSTTGDYQGITEQPRKSRSSSKNNNAQFIQNKFKYYSTNGEELSNNNKEADFENYEDEEDEVVNSSGTEIVQVVDDVDENESNQKKNTVDEVVDKTIVPSVRDQQRFRKSLENAASMVFHSRTGLPLTSSPAPLRKGHYCFDFDSSLNSVSSKRSALFELNTPPSPGAVSLEEGDKEVENVCDIEVIKRRSNSRNRVQSHALLGNFEESALNGRLEPVSTIHGFTAEVGASGLFCPKHQKFPVTVFFYTLGDNDKTSTPYLAHINLGKKGYHVPRVGTIQVTLSNPLGTVVKMFVVLYDLSDMPPRSHTFLRQRTLRDKTLRYLIHLRFMSGKSGRIYLHTDIRMIICRKSDVDTASEFGSEPAKELRSYVDGPTNPKFSPRC